MLSKHWGEADVEQMAECPTLKTLTPLKLAASKASSSAV